jgi:hypothetical protein
VKHHVEVNLNLPKEDLEDLIDKTTTSVITVVVVVTLAHILKANLA